jgi:tetratricopeptide (TPR) repeat protein
MAKWHMSEELLAALGEREIDPATYLMLLVEHLMDVCPDCAESVRSFVERQAEEPAGASRPRLVRDGFLDRIALCRHRSAIGDRAARLELEELLALEGRGERRRRVLAAARGFRSPELVELLLDVGRDRVATQPAEALDLAELAELVARRVPDALAGPELAHDLAIKARGHRSDALRATGALERAEEVMGEVLAMAESSADVQLGAEIAVLAASLARALRHWEGAGRHLDRAIFAYRELGCPQELTEALVRRAEIASLAGRPEEALEPLEQARTALDECARGALEVEPLLVLSAHHLHARALCDLGFFVEAAALVDETAPLYAAVGPLAELELAWVRGRVARGLGAAAEAEAHLVAARDGFLAAGHGYDAALVALDLADLFLDAGLTREVRQLGAFLLALFETTDIHREAMTALTLLARAAEHDALTADELRRVSHYLSQMRASAPAAVREAVS